MYKAERDAVMKTRPNKLIRSLKSVIKHEAILESLKYGSGFVKTKLLLEC